MPSLISSMVVFGDSISLKRSFGPAVVQSGLNDPPRVAGDRLVRAVRTGPDLAVEGGAGDWKRLRHLADRGPHGPRDVESGLLGRGSGAAIAPTETERCCQLGHELVEFVLDRLRP